MISFNDMMSGDDNRIIILVTWKNIILVGFCVIVQEIEVFEKKYNHFPYSYLFLFGESLQSDNIYKQRTQSAT